MLSYTITVPPTVGTAVSTASFSTSYLATEDNSTLSENQLGTTSASGSGNDAIGTMSNGNITMTFAAGGGISVTDINIVGTDTMTDEGGDASQTQGAGTTSWNGRVLPESYESSGFTSGTISREKQTTTEMMSDVAVIVTTTTSTASMVGATTSSLSNDETIAVATTTTSTAEATRTTLATDNIFTRAITTVSEKVTAYGPALTVTTETETVDPAFTENTLSVTTKTLPPTNTGFRHTATVVMLDGNEVVWRPTTSGTLPIEDMCDYYQGGTHTLYPITTALDPVQTPDNYEETFGVTSSEGETTVLTAKTSATSVVSSADKTFPGQTVSATLNKLSSTTRTTSVTETDGGAIFTDVSTGWTTTGSSISVDNINVPTTVATTSEFTFTKTYGANGLSYGYTVQPWTWLKIAERVVVENPKAFESKYFNARANFASEIKIGQDLEANGLTISAPSTAIGAITAVLPYPTSWQYAENSATFTVSLNGRGATISSENSSTSGSRSGDWRVNGGSTCVVDISERLSPAGKAPIGKITAYAGMGRFFTTKNGQTGILSAINFSSREIQEGEDRVASSAAPLVEAGFITGDGSYWFATTRNHTAVIAETRRIF